MKNKIKTTKFSCSDELGKLTLETKKMISYLIFFENAEGKIKINNKETEISKFSVVNFPILSTIKLEDIAENSKGWCVEFDKQARDIFLIHSFQVFCPFTGIVKTDTDKQIFNKLEFYIQQIETEILLNNISSDEIVYLQTALIIKYIHRNITNNNFVGQLTDDNLLKFTNLVNKEFKNNHNIEFYTNKIGLSTKALNRLTRQIINVTPKQIIHYRINAEAIRLLIHSKQSIKEIAYELNFSSPDYFNYFFKKLNKLSPSAYKKQMSENCPKISLDFS